MKNTLFTSAILLISLTTNAQLNNGDFENWTNLSQHVYETEMIDSHNVLNPLHGDITDWTYSFDVGISQTTDAYTGNYAAILHNWYNYAKTSLVYRDTMSSYPNQLTGHYKYISDLFTTGTVKVVVLSSAGDTVMNKTENLIPVDGWTSFSVDLSPSVNPINPVDSVIITFTNATESCQGNMMTCNLLFIDDLTLSNSVASLEDLNVISYEMFPNPSDGIITINYGGFIPEDRTLLEISDMSGKVVLSHKIEGTETILDVQHFEAGTYIVKFSTHNGRAEYRKLIVQ